MGYERWNIYEIARSCFRHDFEMLTPTHTCPTADYANDTFQFTMMVCARFCVRFDRDRTCPQFASADPCICNSSRASYPVFAGYSDQAGYPESLSLRDRASVISGSCSYELSSVCLH